MPSTTIEDKSKMNSDTPMESPNAQVQEPAGSVAAPEAPQKKKPIVAIIIGVVILLAIGIFGYTVLVFNQTHASTDDAYVNGSNTAISPQISGNVLQVLVHDNQVVKQGQLLAVIDPRPYRALVDQAQANYDAAVAAAKSAGIGVALTQLTGDAQVQVAEGSVTQAQSGIESAYSGVAKAKAGESSALSGVASAHAEITAANSQLANSKANLSRAKGALAADQAAVNSAKAAIKVAQANVASAEAQNKYAQSEAVRFQNLANQGAVSQEEAEEKVSTAQSAAAKVAGAQQQAEAATAGLAQAEANLSAAQGGVAGAEAGIKQAQSQIAVANSQLNSAKAGYRASLAEVSAANQQISSAKAHETQTLGELSQAQTVSTQVSSSEASKAVALAKVEQAKAELQQAKLNLSFTRIYSPIDGRVTNKNCDVGQLVSPNAPVMAIVNNQDAYIWANFKETQMDGIEPGQPASISVDAIPGYTFKGHVQSIQAGTGSTFTLIPPDNASGNFTKVVQRIPVKVYFDQNQPHLDELITGQSVEVVVTLKK